MPNSKPEKDIDINQLDSDLAAAQKLEQGKNTIIGRIAMAFAFAMSLFHILTVFRQLDVIPQRGVHVAFAFTILFLSMPLYEHVFKDKYAGNPTFRLVCRVVDILLVLATWASVYMCSYEYDHLSDNLGRAGIWAAVAGGILLVLTLEAARRCLGYIMPALGLIFIVYALVGEYLPGQLGHKGYSFSEIFKYLAVDLDGIFGTTISVSASTIFMFVMFGAFLEASGCSTFINDLALSVTGKLRCGPALAAVVASALMGCINGSAVANVVGTGTFTIPLMKSRGYKPDFAAGVEAVSSTGGQILPPVMGAGAFLMVAFTGEPYTAVVVAAAIPAVLYFLGAAFAVFAQGEVGNVELLPPEQIPRTRDVLKDGWIYLVIIGALVYALLVAQYSPALSGLIGCAAVPLVMLFDKKKRYTLKQIPSSMVKAGYGALSIVAGCACAGIVVAMVSRTGIGIVFGDMMINAAGRQTFLSLLFTAIACIILGMGLPTTSSYIIAASILAPALAKLGIPILTAHLFVFYFACLSAITPPVALAAYAGAGIAKCDPMTTAVHACRIGFAGFIVPFVFCYNSALMLDGSILEIVKVCGTAIVGCAGLSCGLQGWFFSKQRKISVQSRVFVIAMGFCMMMPSDLFSIIGIAGLAAMASFEISRTKKLNAVA